MARFFLLIGPVFAAAAPVLAAEERATINVSLKIEPFCAARSVPASNSAGPSFAIDCARNPQRAGPGREGSPPYSVRTVRNARGTVISFEF
ncbi:hypothetical protein [Parafrankia sp. BMG5.11]|uniref:hypothetical protein n=1 Tax=Parafrankia sp. BMG5.11 TaxID=222540 RepID=UPI00103AF46D|nr:hypothetical protein [Parafrankia sp. BMG5.11]TCJ39028.1 hypothetical protein E0504_12130 [Parafrankia sp. BMG5.11]